MGCGILKSRIVPGNLGALRAQPKVSLLLTMIFLFTYFFYCLTASCCESQPGTGSLRPGLTAGSVRSGSSGSVRSGTAGSVRSASAGTLIIGSEKSLLSAFTGSVRSGSAGSVRSGTTGSVRSGSPGSVRSGSAVSVRSGSAVSVRSGSAGSVRSGSAESVRSAGTVITGAEDSLHSGSLIIGAEDSLSSGSTGLLASSTEDSLRSVSVFSAATLNRTAPSYPAHRAALSSGAISISNSFGSKKFPQAIIVGVKKGGTRALLEFLRIHPDVRALGAEPHFFDRCYDKGLEWYRNLMPRTLEGQITMEKTPSYFVTMEAPRRIYNMSRDTKLIVVVRNPVTRAISDYTQTLSKTPSLPSFQELAFKNVSIGLIDTSWSAIRIGIYAKHLDNWLQHFPLSKFLFVSGERLVSDPAGEMGRVQDFLGLKRVITDKHFYFNETKGFPCLKKPEGSSKPRCLGKSKGRPHPDIDKKVLLRLQEFYRPFNMKFYQMTGQDFGWD